MQRLIIVKLAAVAIILASSCNFAKADGMPYPSLKDPIAARPVSCYVKAFGAGEFIQNDVDLAGIAKLPLGSNGLGIGGQFGCDVTQGIWVLGAFADYTYNKADSNINVLGTTVLGVPFGNEWGVGARLGVNASQSTMIYALAAYTAAQNRNVNMGGIGLSLDGPKGITVGAGFELKLTQNVIASLEYRHTNFDTATTTLIPMTFDTTENVVRIGIGYRF